MKKILLIISAIILVGAVWVVYRQYFSGEKEKTFLTEEACEKETQKSCSFAMCDYVPEGKTFEEVCGKDFQKGWRPK